MVQYVSVAGELNALVKLALKRQRPSTLLEEALLKADTLVTKRENDEACRSLQDQVHSLQEKPAAECQTTKQLHAALSDLLH